MNKEQIKEQVKLSFTGLSADKGILDIDDLSKALIGWNNYWQITYSIYLSKKLSSKPLDVDIRPKIQIRGFENKSFDIWTEIILPIALMAGYDVIKKLWKWRRSLTETHIKSKKEFYTKEDAIKSLRKIAVKFEIEYTTSMEATKVIDIVDDSLNDISEPIDRSAKEIIIRSPQVKTSLKLTSSDKRALRSGYYIDPSLTSKGFTKFAVKFIRIHTQTGKAIVTFDKPSGIHQMGHEYSQIIDPYVREPRNIYTKALYEGSSLEVWGRMVRSKRNNKFLRWEITANLPKEDIPPFFEELFTF